MKKGVKQSANQQRAGSALRAALAAAVRARGIRNENKVDAWNTCSVTNSRGQYSKSQGKQESRLIENHQTSIPENSKDPDDPGQGGSFLNPISFSSDSGICFSPNEQDGRNEHITDDERSSSLTDGLPAGLHHFFSRKMSLHYNFRCYFLYFHQWLRFVNESNLKSTCEYNTIERAKRSLRKLRVDSCFVRWFDWKRNKRSKRRTYTHLDLRHSCFRKDVAWQAWLGMIKDKKTVPNQLNSLQCCDSAGVVGNEINSILAAATPHPADLKEFEADNLSSKNDSPSVFIGGSIQTQNQMCALSPDHNQPGANYDTVSKQIILLEEQISTEIERIEDNMLLYILNVELILHMGCSNIKDREISWGQEKAAYESR